MAQPNESAGAAADPLAALTAALKSLLPNWPATILQKPTFEWTTFDQYDEFELFWESTESWFQLQAIPDEPDDNGACLEYILNFLGTTGHWKWNQWTPSSVTTDDIAAASVTTDDIAAARKSVKSFLDHLASQKDHTLSQWCQIYQLKDVRINAGETPDEYVDHLRALTNRCNFPTDEEKGWNVQFCLVHALKDSKLAKKLLNLDPEATTAKILETCRTHSHTTQPQCYMPQIQNYQYCQQTEPMT